MSKKQGRKTTKLSTQAPEDTLGLEEATFPLKAEDVVPVLRVPRAKLEVVQGPDQGKNTDLRHHRVVVGSGPGCDFALSDPTVSRRHFELFFDRESYFLRDVGSTNGTFVRGLRVRSVHMGPQEEIKVGNTVLGFSVLDTHDEFPLSQSDSFGTLLGRSKLMREVFSVLERTAGSDATLLLEGESGTGKDLAAENVHRHSPRKDGPFVIVDCGAVTPSLVGSELFGHCRGAFTGAERDRKGAVEEAEGGSVFLDEIGNIDLSLQPQLLRLLERREVKRVGENRWRPVNVRIIAATNLDLAHEVKEGRFREDLFYRVSVIRVRMPPLRDRREDIRFLAEAFIRKLGGGVPPEEIFTKELLSMFYNHDWPGNIRELRNVIERLLVLPGLPDGFRQKPERTGEFGVTPANVSDRTLEEWKAAFEEQYLKTLLEAFDGVVAEAAKKAGVARQSLYRLLKRYKLVK